MKRSMLIAAILVGSTILLAFNGSAWAMYHPGMGVFLQRDPGVRGAVRFGTARPAIGGDFIPRDEYGDGMNLYQYVRSRPTIARDPSGLSGILGPIRDNPLIHPNPILPLVEDLVEDYFFPPPPCDCPLSRRRTAKTCCDLILVAGKDEGAVGGVICCDGRKITCLWKPGGLTGAKDPQAKKIVEYCARLHEDLHHKHVPDCPRGCDTLERPNFKLNITPSEGECEAHELGLKCLQNNKHNCNANTQCEIEVDEEIGYVQENVDYYCPRAKKGLY